MDSPWRQKQGNPEQAGWSSWNLVGVVYRVLNARDSSIAPLPAGYQDTMAPIVRTARDGERWGFGVLMVPKNGSPLRL